MAAGFSANLISNSRYSLLDYHGVFLDTPKGNIRLFGGKAQRLGTST